MVEITDSSTEVVYTTVSAVITANSNQGTAQDLFDKLNSVQDQIPLKYAYMTAIVNAMHENESETLDPAYIAEQVFQRETLLDQIEKDI